MVGSARKVVPPLKWAGGKRWFVNRYIHLFPSTFNRYFEPFLGGGAAFFALAPKNAVISDVNSELINFYCVVRDHWQELAKLLDEHQAQHSKDYYYEVRSREAPNRIAKAAQFLYLNRTCWNGLYRVNKEGQFNVPVGTKSNVVMPTDNFEAAANLLQSAVIRIGDFQETIEGAEEGDLIFCDPPYTANHNLNGFRKYNEKLFSWEDQLRLRKVLSAAAKRGARIFLTNAHHESVYDLYADEFEIQSLDRHSILAADSRNRIQVQEFLITSNK